MAKKVAKKVAKDVRPPHEAAGASPEAGGSGPMSVPLLEQLVRLMSDNDLTSLELRDGEQRIALSRGGPPAPAYDAPPPPVAPMRRDPAAPQPPAPAEAPAASNLTEIKSPMVGTFYNSPSPDAKAFVSVGDKVGPDTDVCIIEAMKVFNNIKAEVGGTVEKVLVENGSAVEYGQALFLVRP